MVSRVFTVDSTDWCISCMLLQQGVYLYVEHILCFHYSVRLPTSTLLGGFHSQLLRAPLHLHLLLPRELQPLPEVHPILLSGAHCVPSVSGQQHLQWVQCGVHHPQPDEVQELLLHCHRTPWQPKGKDHHHGKHSHAK